MVNTPVRRGPVAAALALLAATAALSTVLVFAVAVHTREGQRLDDAARGDLSSSGATRALAATQRLLDTISVSSLALFGLGIMGIALLRRSPVRAAGAGVVVLGANLTTQAAKAHFDRPDLVGGGAAGEGAFPSGHVTVAMSLAMALVLVAPASFRGAAAVAGCLYATAVGTAVIALDWHRPSEVVGAYLVSVAWVAAVAAVIASVARDEPPPPAHAVARPATAIAVVLGLAFAAVVGARAAQRFDVMGFVDDRTSFAAGAAVCAVVCAGLCAVVAALLQRADSDNGETRARDR